MKILKHDHFPLERSYLCENCMTVGNCSTVCPACGDETSLINLAGVMNRETECVRALTVEAK